MQSPVGHPADWNSIECHPSPPNMLEEKNNVAKIITVKTGRSVCVVLHVQHVGVCVCAHTCVCVHACVHARLLMCL